MVVEIQLEAQAKRQATASKIDPLVVREVNELNEWRRRVNGKSN